MIFIFLLPLFSACSLPKAPDVDSAEGLYEFADRLANSGRSEEGIARFQELRSRFPQHPLAVEADLRIADARFRLKDYADAYASYRLFVEFHPSHPKLDYVIFQMGMSKVHQLPSTSDRDLSNAKDALNAFNRLERQFPHSEYLEEARKEKKNTLRKLAERELYIANFYFRSREFLSASRRFKGYLHQYPFFDDLTPKALLGLVRSFDKLEDTAARDDFAHQLLHQFPDSPEAKSARAEFKSLQ